MSEESINLDFSLAGDSQALLERVSCAEFLFAKGHLASDLEQLPPQVAKNLVVEACRFAVPRLLGLEFIKGYPIVSPSKKVRRVIRFLCLGLKLQKEGNLDENWDHHL